MILVYNPLYFYTAQQRTTPMNKTAYNKHFIEFFAGTGLVREGLEKDGWKCLWANDICPDKQSAYVDNFGAGDFLLGDIWELTKRTEQLPSEAFLATASFPCTDLSVAGSRKGLKGEASGTLIAFLQIIEKLNDKPPVLLLENVQGFLTSHKGADVSFTINELNKLGYVVSIVELDARYFTPQSRPRVFVVAVLSQLAPSVMVTNQHSANEHFSAKLLDNAQFYTKKVQSVYIQNSKCSLGVFDLPSLEDTKLKLHDIVEDLDHNNKYWWSNDRVEKLCAQMSANHSKTLNHMMNQNKVTYGTVYRRVRNSISMAELRTDGIAGCLRTPKGGSSKQILVAAGNGKVRVRFLTPREYARLQGVDDSFILSKNDTKAYFAMGDAVCVPALTWLSKNILSICYERWLSLLSSENAA
ncbi:DNA cytosine methyltransferase [Photobacterium ganghwense]|uniref:DNA cytosine methyltransferase n=1 Tax=Photobacterium ganghwense TaxID=320778 RepID=UPI001A90AA81|nr:DNA (cytosine-5-)-methyltransferase [Photobacterium ganghwense]QSV17336.1 DNA (cytosine-5-)-methyltransferase [Photobacterium ganghwense]